MANVLLFKSITCPTSEQYSLRNFQLQKQFSWLLVWFTIVFSTLPVLVSPKKQVFCPQADPICHCHSEYTKSSTEMNDIFSFQYPNVIALQIATAILQAYILQCLRRGEPSSDTPGRTFPFSFHPTLSTHSPTKTTITQVVCDNTCLLSLNGSLCLALHHTEGYL